MPKILFSSSRRLLTPKRDWGQGWVGWGWVGWGWDREWVWVQSWIDRLTVGRVCSNCSQRKHNKNKNKRGNSPLSLLCNKIMRLINLLQILLSIEIKLTNNKRAPKAQSNYKKAQSNYKRAKSNYKKARNSNNKRIPLNLIPTMNSSVYANPNR